MTARGHGRRGAKTEIKIKSFPSSGEIKNRCLLLSGIARARNTRAMPSRARIYRPAAAREMATAANFAAMARAAPAARTLA
jgi:hypothetical protein